MMLTGPKTVGAQHKKLIVWEKKSKDDQLLSRYSFWFSLFNNIYGVCSANQSNEIL